MSSLTRTIRRNVARVEKQRVIDIENAKRNKMNRAIRKRKNKRI